VATDEQMDNAEKVTRAAAKEVETKLRSRERFTGIVLLRVITLRS
jgi:hypothetical protein